MNPSRKRADASADDPVEMRRGRPRTRLDHPSDLLDRVKTGAEIRSYNRKRSVEPKLFGMGEEDPKQSLLKTLTKIVSEPNDKATTIPRAGGSFNKPAKPLEEIPDESSNDKFEKMTNDSSISDTEKLQLLQSNTLVNRKLYAKGRSGIGVGESATSPTVGNAQSLSPSGLPPLKRRPEVSPDDSPSLVATDLADNPLQRGSAGQGKRNGKRGIFLDRPMSIDIEELADVDEDDLGKNATTNSSESSADPDLSGGATGSNATTAAASEAKTTMPPLKRFRPIAPAPGPIMPGPDPNLNPAPPSLSSPLLGANWKTPAGDETSDVGTESSSSVAESIKCFFCRFEAYDRLEFFQHMRHEHLAHPLVKCNLCPIRCNDDESLKKHYVKEHFTCKLCGYVEMAYEHGVETHLRFHHNEEDRRHSCGGQLEPVELPIPKDFGSAEAETNNLQCTQCGLLTTYQQFFNQEFLRKSRSTRFSRYECSHCPYETRDLDAFQRHQEHHDKSLWKLEKCRLCDFVTHEEDLLKAHLQQHLKGTALKCETCRFYTIGENRMALHRTVHTGIKPLKCSYCNFIAVSPKTLSHHLKSHFNDVEPLKGDLIVKCGQCDYHGVWQDVDNHVRTHAKTENHKCVLCSREFASKTGYKKHLQQHMGEYPFPCPSCDKGFFDEYTLRDHIFAHQGIKPYQCVCGSKYQRKKNLIVHEKTCLHHQEQLLRNYGREADKGAPSRPSLFKDNEEAATLDTWMQAGGIVQEPDGSD